jgi:ATP-dependent DNA helicase RecQ
LQANTAQSAKEKTKVSGFSPNCLSLDLEVGKKDGRIHAFAGINGKTGQSYVYRQGDLGKALAELDEFARGTDFLLGHNLIAFDIPHLKAASPTFIFRRVHSC